MSDCYDVFGEPISISKSIFDLFLNEKNPGDLLTLYAFYYYTAKYRQGTNQVWATVEYVAKGLKWSLPKVRNARVILKELKLIEDIQLRGERGKLGKMFTKVNFIWKSDRTLDFNSAEKPECRNRETNALSVLKENALKRNIKEKNFSAIELLKLLPDSFQEDVPFRKAWKSFITYKRENTKVSVTDIMTKGYITQIENDNLTVKEVTKQLCNCVASGYWQGPNLHKIREYQQSTNNTSFHNKRTPHQLVQIPQFDENKKEGKRNGVTHINV